MSDGTTNLGELLAARLAKRPGLTVASPAWPTPDMKLAARARERAQAAEARISCALQMLDDAIGGFRPAPSLQALKRALTEDYPPTAEAQATLSFPMDDQGRPV